MRQRPVWLSFKITRRAATLKHRKKTADSLVLFFFFFPFFFLFFPTITGFSSAPLVQPWSHEVIQGGGGGGVTHFRSDCELTLV